MPAQTDQGQRQKHGDVDEEAAMLMKNWSTSL
ncbi:hypothetical protein BJY21_004004 [Kineosphaera limosa]|nr:hypothetical protein [Kineosphaera limosa]